MPYEWIDADGQIVEGLHAIERGQLVSIDEGSLSAFFEAVAPLLAPSQSRPQRCRAHGVGLANFKRGFDFPLSSGGRNGDRRGLRCPGIDGEGKRAERCLEWNRLPPGALRRCRRLSQKRSRNNPRAGLRLEWLWAEDGPRQCKATIRNGWKAGSQGPPELREREEAAPDLSAVAEFVASQGVGAEAEPAHGAPGQAFIAEPSAGRIRVR